MEAEVGWGASGVGKGSGWPAPAGWGRRGPRTDGPARGQVPGGLRALDSKQYSVSRSLLVLLSASTSRAGEEARDMGP